MCREVARHILDQPVGKGPRSVLLSQCHFSKPETHQKVHAPGGEMFSAPKHQSHSSLPYRSAISTVTCHGRLCVQGKGSHDGKCTKKLRARTMKKGAQIFSSSVFIILGPRTLNAAKGARSTCCRPPYTMARWMFPVSVCAVSSRWRTGRNASSRRRMRTRGAVK